MARVDARRVDARNQYAAFVMVPQPLVLWHARAPFDHWDPDIQN